MDDEGKTGTTGGSSNGRGDTTPELRFSLAVAVRHPDIDPEVISVALGRTPYQAWQAGMPRRTPSGQPMPSVGRESYWICTIEICGQRNFFAALVEEADRLASCADFLHGIAAAGGRIGLVVSLPGGVNIGATLPHAALKRLAELPIDLGIEVFPDMP
ncbi:MAG: hypothetical protein NTY94_09550 [Alphaproteobacteria bacterium]|nr:hypothetical protein [Alphaproteobacteria bacterium]